MSSQRKANLFGCTSVHKASGGKNASRSVMTVDQFLDLNEIKQYVASHPDSVTRQGGDVYISPELTLRYLHLCGNKRLKKEFRKATKGQA